ncbi:MAG: hypothetical protein KAG61_10290, partial [Bacteriovoracaceae bacterium]|nr:hypothetical protein [Bacteriovoracaceae bacterium]
NLFVLLWVIIPFFINISQRKIKQISAPLNNTYVVPWDDLGEYLKLRLSKLNYLFSPNLLTTMGVIGTFWGIATGLPDGKIDDVALKVLIGGMKVAFWTSIGGLVCAGALISINQLVRFCANIRVKNILKSGIFKSNSTDHSLEKMTLLIEKLDFGGIAEALTSVSTNINPRVTGEIIAKSLDQSLANTLSPLVEQVRSLQDASSRDSQKLHVSLSEIGAAIDPEKTATAISNSLEAILGPVFKSLDSKLEFVSELSSTVLEMKETNLKLDQFIRTDLNSIFEKVNDSFVEAQTAMNTTNDSLKLTKESLDSQSGNMKILDSALSNFTSEMDRLVNEQTESFKAYLSTGEETIRVTGKECSELILNANTKFSSTLHGVDEKLEKTGTYIQENLQQFISENNNFLDQYLERQSAQLEDILGQNIQGINSAVENLNSSYGEFFDKNLNIVEKQTVAIKDVGEVIQRSEMSKNYYKDLLSDSNKSMAESAGRLAEGLVGSVTNSEEFKNILEQFSTNFEGHTVGILTKYQKDVDEHISKILGNIQDVSMRLLLAKDEDLVVKNV